MNILVVGLGSMGKRRIRLLQKYFQDTVVYGTDTSEERRQGAQEEFGLKTSPDMKTAFGQWKIDGVLVCTSPLYHYAIIMEALAAGKHVFTEINLLLEGYGEMIERAQEKNVKLFLSSTMNYRREIRYLQGEIQKQTGKLHYMYHVGQYLPDWHPWENYKNFFVGDKRTNGCREIMAIQLPWMIKTFGDVESFKVLSGNLTTLEIDYPDSFLLMLQHKGGHAGVVCFDIVSRSASTRLEIIGEQLHILWGGTPDSLKNLDIEGKAFQPISLYETIDKHSGYSANIIENAYVDELQAFFELVNKGSQPIYTFEDDRKTLTLIDSIESVSAL
ncbi:MAG: Gfo/Idh/MocA family oxidoreductase [Eubacteriales bacterium]